MEKLTDKLNDKTRGWSDFLFSDKEGYHQVCDELKNLTCFADMTLGSAHKMCKNLHINGRKLSIHEFTKFFDNENI